ncbi:Irregular chiasm C-roughest protein [Penaeus vannamei]|uniref:Irregular chiasm C-roughest protein n=1 Tax=Penaeus vannamei TaxID=6689 RepID=A0A3R7Q2P3_PENVA|nr:Irregular chiasm C-roughest protein [Penaeus vannamei]
MRVLLKGPPQIVSASDQQGRKGETVSLECSTVSIPSPIRVTWTYNGQEIDFSDPRYDLVEDEEKEGVRNYLVIHDADEEDFGAYNCSVVNEYGVAQMLIRLKQEKTLPVYALVWGSLGLIVTGLVVTGIIVCTRRRAIIRDTPMPEKPLSVMVVPGLPAVNMYSVSSDSKLWQGLTPTPTPTRTSTPSPLNMDALTPTATVPPTHTFSSLSQDSDRAFIVDPDAEGGRGYVPFVDYDSCDYAPPSTGRRVSCNDVGLHRPSPRPLRKFLSLTSAPPSGGAGPGICNSRGWRDKACAYRLPHRHASSSQPWCFSRQSARRFCFFSASGYLPLPFLHPPSALFTRRFLDFSTGHS